jgi:alpha-beta hydrolase superfamily lysophospholipase
VSGTVTHSAGSLIARDGTSIAYALHTEARSEGSPTRPRIALIHSLALDQSIWDGVVPLLTGYADVLTYDCRGHGKSGRPKMKFTLELFAADLAGLLDHLGWPSVGVDRHHGVVRRERTERLARARWHSRRQGLPGVVGISGNTLGE